MTISVLLPVVRGQISGLDQWAVSLAEWLELVSDGGSAGQYTARNYFRFFFFNLINIPIYVQGEYHVLIIRLLSHELGRIGRGFRYFAQCLASLNNYFCLTFLYIYCFQTNGAADIEAFKIEGNYFIAIANSLSFDESHNTSRTYFLNSSIYKLDVHHRRFVKFQDIRTNG